jgi:hypothetical protein
VRPPDKQEKNRREFTVIKVTKLGFRGFRGTLIPHPTGDRLLWIPWIPWHVDSVEFAF